MEINIKHAVNLKIAYVLIVLMILSLGSLQLLLYHNSVPALLFETELFKNGDLILRKGYGLFSNIFCSIGNQKSPYSHVGIIYKVDKEVYVIHTEANEITGIGFAKKEHLNTFLENASSAALYRVNALKNIDRESIVSSAMKYVRDKIPFDMDFNLHDDAKLYCTELVYKAFKANGFNIFGSPSLINVHLFGKKINKEALTLDQLLDKDDLRLIINLK